MNRDKKTMLTLILLAIALIDGCSYNENLYLIIQNKSNYTVSNILLNYTSSKEYIAVKRLNAGEESKVKINNSKEDSLKIKYTIKNHSIEKVAIGYFVKNMHGTKYFIIK